MFSLQLIWEEFKIEKRTVAGKAQMTEVTMMTTKTRMTMVTTIMTLVDCIASEKDIIRQENRVKIVVMV